MQAAYRLTMPERRRTPFVFASPHSGRDYSAAFLQKSVLDERTIRSSEDAFVDLLFEAAPGFGAPLISASAPRAYVDLNRAAEELDPTLIEGVRRSTHNPRVSSGLGVIPRVVANGRAIYRGKISLCEAEARLREHWYPYHAALESLMSETRVEFGQAILIDCHSMPHEALENVVHPDGLRPDIVLGDRFGASASMELVERVEAALAAAGLKIVRNAPFAGAYSAQRYGRPAQGRHVVQIEIDRSLYMNEQTVRPNANFKAFRDLLTGVIAEIVGAERAGMPLAAE